MIFAFFFRWNGSGYEYKGHDHFEKNNTDQQIMLKNKTKLSLRYEKHKG